MQIPCAWIGMSIALAVPALPAAPSADLTPAQRAEGEARVKTAARYFATTLRDSSSAAFRNVFIRRRGERISICGEVNARNGYGGYTGFQAFMVLADQRVDVGRVAGFDITYLCQSNNPIIDTRDYAPEMRAAYAAALRN
jgi:hypothetical protein